MFYIATLSSPGRGGYVFGHLKTDSPKAAQEKVCTWMIESLGIPREELTIQVSDYTTITFQGTEITITPIKPLSTLQTVRDFLTSK